MERREGERTPLDRPATLDTRRHTQSARTVDVSRGGACVRCDTMLVESGETVTLTVDAVRARGSVTWKTMDRLGIRFEIPIAVSALQELTA